MQLSTNTSVKRRRRKLEIRRKKVDGGQEGGGLKTTPKKMVFKVAFGRWRVLKGGGGR